MSTFAELLAEYMARTGISDADMARRVGVSRLTLIRWKEGVTARPRYREDVLTCAELLRLTPAERDGLLLAAGFAPEEATAAPEASEPAGPVEPPPLESIEGAAGTAEKTPRPGKSRRIAAAVVGALALALAAGAAVTQLLGGTAYPTAADGESLILVAPFVNYTAGQQGFNVRGRIIGEIDGQIQEAGIASARTDEWPDAIDGETAALEAGQRSRAAIVIWGEYDSGRAIARLTVPRTHSEPREQILVDIVSSPADLPTTINVDLTDEVRSLALLTLGQVYLEQGEFDPAKIVLLQSLAKPPVDSGALASLWYRLGRAYQGGRLIDLDEAISMFSRVLAVQPRSAEAYNSRGLAYLARGRSGDISLAIANLTQAASLTPQTEAPLINRAVAYMERGQPGDLRSALADLDRAIKINPQSASALVNRAVVRLRMGAAADLDTAFDDLDRAVALQPELATAYLNRGNAYLERGDLDLALEEFTRAIDLAPSSPTAFFNRGLVHSALEDMGSSIADLRRAQELSPKDPLLNNTLCWQLGVQRLPEAALPYCELALEEAPGGLALDSRGLVYGVMGRYPDAIADFRAFLTWANASQKDACGAYYSPSRQEWTAKMEAGEDPFDAETLRDLRLRPATLSDGAPC